MKTISMLELRQDSKSVIRSLRRGERIFLTHRGKPLARLEPASATKDAWEDAIFHVEKLAKPSPLGRFNHDEIDEIVYGKS